MAKWTTPIQQQLESSKDNPLLADYASLLSSRYDQLMAFAKADAAPSLLSPDSKAVKQHVFEEQSALDESVLKSYKKKLNSYLQGVSNASERLNSVQQELAESILLSIGYRFDGWFLMGYVPVVLLQCLWTSTKGVDEAQPLADAAPNESGEHTVTNPASMHHLDAKLKVLLTDVSEVFMSMPPETETYTIGAIHQGLPSDPSKPTTCAYFLQKLTQTPDLGDLPRDDIHAELLSKDNMKESKQRRDFGSADTSPDTHP